MQDKYRRKILELDIKAALDAASFCGWPADERDLLELVNIVLETVQHPSPQQNVTVEHSVRSARDPYLFLYSVR